MMHKYVLKYRSCFDEQTFHEIRIFFISNRFLAFNFSKQDCINDFYFIKSVDQRTFTLSCSCDSVDAEDDTI